MTINFITHRRRNESKSSNVSDGKPFSRLSSRYLKSEAEERDSTEIDVTSKKQFTLRGLLKPWAIFILLFACLFGSIIYLFLCPFLVCFCLFCLHRC